MIMWSRMRALIVILCLLLATGSLSSINKQFNTATGLFVSRPMAFYTVTQNVPPCFG